MDILGGHEVLVGTYEAYVLGYAPKEDKSGMLLSLNISCKEERDHVQELFHYMYRADGKSQVRQCLGFYTADFFPCCLWISWSKTQTLLNLILLISSVQSGAEGWGKGFVTCFLRVPQAFGLNCSCHAAQARKGNFQKICYKPIIQPAAPDFDLKAEHEYLYIWKKN